MLQQLGNEVTAQKADWREQLDLSTPHPVRKPSDPLYHNLLAPNQWPSKQCLPDFQPAFEEYMRQMSVVSMYFTSLIAESLDMPPSAFDAFFDAQQQHKLKVVKYPDGGDGVGQGVGPHKDSTYTGLYYSTCAPRTGERTAHALAYNQWMAWRWQQLTDLEACVYLRTVVLQCH